MQSKKKPTPSKALSTEARALWLGLQEEYAIIDMAGVALLNRLAESLDLLRQAQKELKKGGLTIVDQRGSLKPNPVTIIVDKSHKQMLDALRLLRLDLEPKVKT